MQEIYVQIRKIAPFDHAAVVGNIWPINQVNQPLGCLWSRQLTFLSRHSMRNRTFCGVCVLFLRLLWMFMNVGKEPGLIPSVLKLAEIVIVWVYYTIPFGFTLIWHFRAIIFNVWNHFVWLRITDEGSLPEMRIWSILLIKSDLKWSIHLSRSLFS